MSHKDASRYSLNDMLARAGLATVTADQNIQFAVYLDLLIKWNARMNLTSVRDPDAILERHFVECIACAKALPAGIGSLLDLGSGAGFPGIPIAISRPEIAVTLAESQAKKAAFLREVQRSLNLGFQVFAGRAEDIGYSFDCVTMRAVDKMREAIRTGSRLLHRNGTMALLITRISLGEAQDAAGPFIEWEQQIHLPGSEQRLLALGRLTSAIDRD